MKGQGGILFESGYVCPICGFPAVYEAPMHLTGPGCSLEFCPACGYQFGVGYGPFGEWRERWSAEGKPWRRLGVPAPEWWDPEEHLARLYGSAPCALLSLRPDETEATGRVLGSAEMKLLSRLAQGVARRDLTILVDALSDIVESQQYAALTADDRRLLYRVYWKLVRAQETWGRRLEPDLFESGYTCSVCGFPAAPTPPARLDPPFWWSTIRCPACGYDYGKGYGRIGVGAGPFLAWRNGWTANGRSWQGEAIGYPAPDWWDAEGQLARLYDDAPCASVSLGPEEAAAVRAHLDAGPAALLGDLPHSIARRELTALIDALADVALDRTAMASLEVDERRLLDGALRMLVRTQELIGRRDAARPADAPPSGEVR